VWLACGSAARGPLSAVSALRGRWSRVTTFLGLGESSGPPHCAGTSMHLRRKPPTSIVLPEMIYQWGRMGARIRSSSAADQEIFVPGQRGPSGATRNLLGAACLCSGRSGRLVIEVGVQPDSSVSTALAWAYGLVAFTCQGSAGKGGADLDAWIRPLCALVVAGAAAYASYIHQRELARLGGVNTVSAEAGARRWMASGRPGEIRLGESPGHLGDHEHPGDELPGDSMVHGREVSIRAKSPRSRNVS